MNAPNTTDIEIAVAHHFNPRTNLVVPNVWWGMGFAHECDLFVLTKAGYGYEVEIKVSRADLKKDREKDHGHRSKKLKKLYFAIPEKLLENKEFIPERAGIFVITPSTCSRGWRAKKVREAETCGSYKFSAEERFQIVRLAALRIFPLKERLAELQKQKTFQTELAINEGDCL